VLFALGILFILTVAGWGTGLTFPCMIIALVPFMRGVAEAREISLMIPMLLVSYLIMIRMFVWYLSDLFPRQFTDALLPFIAVSVVAGVAADSTNLETVYGLVSESSQSQSILFFRLLTSVAVIASAASVAFLSFFVAIEFLGYWLFRGSSVALVPVMQAVRPILLVLAISSCAFECTDILTQYLRNSINPVQE
jgi:hypothetical protein